MTESNIIEDPEGLQGESVYDQDGREVGEIKTIYGLGEDKVPMWFGVETKEGIAEKRTVLIPAARLKSEDDQLRVPYSVNHLQDSPEVEDGDEISEEQDRELRDFYAIDLADHEQRTDNISYAAQVPDGEGPATKLEGE